ncbi:amino acid permease [Olsenella profusa]|uniref:APC family permease n=1 Tax=Olsenella profusa TaxID=138595 RepID=A0ABS2F0M6_9ACTN|nr:APC family permease [Olsenella profusa]
MPPLGSAGGPAGPSGGARNAPAAPSTELKRDALGAPSLVFVALAAVAPLSACAANIPLVIGHGNGIAAPLDFALVGAVLLLFSVGFTAMSRHMANAGAFYAYVSEGLGRRMGAAAGYVALFSYNVLTVCTSAMGGYILSNNLAMELGLEIPWWAISLLGWAVIWGLGALGIEAGARFLSVTLVLELAVIAAVAGAVLVQEGPAVLGALSGAPAAVLHGSPGLGLVFAFACFLGFEATADYGEEARDPARTVPLATYAAVVLVGLVFVSAASAMVAALGPEEAVRASQLENAGTILHGIVAARLGEGVGHAYNWLYMVSSVACWLSAHNAASRYLYAFGRAGLLPAALARTHARRKSPLVAGVVQAALGALVAGVCAAAGLSPYAQTGAVASALACVGIMLLEVLLSAAAFAYLRRHRGEPGFAAGAFTTTVAPALSVVLLGAMSVLVLSNLSALTEQDSLVLNVALGLLVPVVAVVGYVLARRRDMRGELPDPATIRVDS